MNRRKFLTQTSIAAIPLVLPWNANFSTNTSEDSLLIGMVADAHQDIINNGEERLGKFVASTLELKTDFNIQLGDFCFPLKENQAFLDIWNQYKGPKYHVLGNHDMDKSDKKAAMNFWGMETPYYSFDVKGYHFVVLDANFLNLEGKFVDYANANFYIDDAHRTWIDPQQIEWLADDLQKTNLPTIIISHQGLAHELWGVKNRRKIQLTLEKANQDAGFAKVIACFNGHNHVDSVRQINGIYYLEMNSLSYQWLGEKYQCHTRFPEKVYKSRPILSKIAPYEDPLYATVKLSKGNITIHGARSKWLGPSPEDLGMPKGFYGIPYSPEISDRELPY